jgi:hypothetical protein
LTAIGSMPGRSRTSQLALIDPLTAPPLKKFDHAHQSQTLAGETGFKNVDVPGGAIDVARPSPARWCMGSLWHTENQLQFHAAQTDRSPQPPGRTHKTTMPEPKSATVVDLQKVRGALPSRYPDGTLGPPGWLYDPPKPYMLSPCQVIAFPAREATSLDKL